MNMLVTVTNCSILNQGTIEILDYVFTAIRIGVPIVAVVLIMKDIVSAVVSGNEDGIKKAQKAMIKRLIITVVIFFVPTIINVLLNVAGQSGCRIG